MSLLRFPHAGGLMLVAVLASCTEDSDTIAPRAQAPSARTPSFTLASGTSSKLLGRATFSDDKDPNFRIKRMTGEWNFEIKAKPAFDLAVQTIDFPKDSHSGWHSHPGPVFIQVVLGTMTFYEGDDPTCTPLKLTAPAGYLDSGTHQHIARNESGAPAQNVVTYFAPPGAVLRVDELKPGNCPF